MTFLSGAAFLALPLLPLIVLFYMLKLKRRREVVPSTLLWRRSVQDLMANAPFQKLRNNLLMWLQLLALAALILALARPMMDLLDSGGTTYVLLVDQSASMQATDAGEGSRLDDAREKARGVIERMTEDDAMIVLAFADRTQIVQTLTGDKGLLRAAVDSIQPRDTQADLEETMRILLGLTTQVNTDNSRVLKPNTKTVLISDGALGAADDLADVGKVEFLPVGTLADNAGITGIDVRESFNVDFEQQVFVSLDNASSEARDLEVELFAGARSLDVKRLPLEPGKNGSLVFTLPQGTAGEISAVLTNRDRLALDNTARAIVAPPRPLSILVVSTGNFFLENAFNVDPKVEVRRVTPIDYPNLREPFDLTVFDGNAPPTLGRGTFLFINATPPLPGFAAGDALENPPIVDWNRVHPLMRFVNMDRVLVGAAKRLELPRAAVPLVSGTDSDLIALWETDTQRVVVVGFDIFKSFWPVDVSFPIFVSNVIDYSRRAGGESSRSAYAAGSVIPVLAPPGVERCEVATPSGEKLALEFAGSETAFLTDTAKAGTYRVAFPDGTEREIAVNLASPLETNITPVEELSVAGRTITGGSGPLRANREVWHWLALLGFVVLGAEWAVYCRRSWL
ncbi:MAG: VWA domain-containing protein [Candidatus Sumerlaeia bacterium]|nr:VWA domain-containing protein [Candidatus Sumerlaeia bacterium]